MNVDTEVGIGFCSVFWENLTAFLLVCFLSLLSNEHVASIVFAPSLTVFA